MSPSKIYNKLKKTQVYRQQIEAKIFFARG